MSKVIFGDVVRRCNTKEDRHNTDKIYYVGGEHIESNEVLIENRGLIEGSTIGPMFYFGFKAGDVLFVSRNPHLRKAGMVTFDGICSEKTFVLETKDESVLLQRYLAFVMQSDHFWSYMEAHKSGSVNFFINWSTLEKYEFELPDISKQKSLSDILWAINDTKKTYRSLSKKMDKLLSSQFLDLVATNEHQVVELNSISTLWTKGQPFKKDDIVEDGISPCIHYGELFTKYGVVINSIYSMTNANKVKTSEVGDILFPASDVTPDGLTKCSALLVGDVMLGGDIIVMRPQEGLNSAYLSFAIRMQREQLLSRITGSVVRHISAKSLQTVKIPILSIEVQNEFEKTIKKSDIAKQEIQQSVDHLIGLERSILVENFN